ncbi:MAG TPA: transcriptional regulator [Candidatus Limnocylindrales bacterium]|nr:transcriptional regulator [Candidatus Limnocylindrales bacterium]
MPESDKKKGNYVLDRIIHEPARLQIISYLATGGQEIPFAELVERLDLTAGNLSVQLKRLEEAGYLSISKSFKDNRPLTSVSLTRRGMDALKHYLQGLETMIDRLKDILPHNELDLR